MPPLNVPVLNTSAPLTKYAVRNCTGRQKRLVSYYKVFRYIFGKGTHGVRRKLPACVCNVVQRWYPDDKHDEEYQRQIEAGEVEYNLDDIIDWGH